MALKPGAERAKEAWETMKKYSDRCSSEHTSLSALARELYKEFDGFISYYSGEIEKGKKKEEIGQEELENFQKIKTTHNEYTTKFNKNNKSIGAFSKQLKKNVQKYDANLKKGRQDEKLAGMINEGYKLLVNTAVETLNLVTKEMPGFYVEIAQAKDEVEKFKQSIKKYIDKLVEVYVPEEMKKQPKAT